jgi:alpha-glucosidase
MVRKLAKAGFKIITIVDPGVKDDPTFGVLKRGEAISAFVRDPKEDKDYVGEVWPGAARFPDFLNARVREWWGDEQTHLQKLGVAGFWNDMNEPANFGLPVKTLPDECVHQSDFGPLSHACVHNVYGMQMARASREGALRRAPNRRPFIISRAAYAGVQRYALLWTGDSSSTWEHLADSVQMLLNLSVSGIPFCGADAGGFVDNCTGELLARWIQLAAFTPFFRNHSNIKTVDQEPWAFGRKVEAICRKYIELRYRLLPYLYGQFVEAHRRGTPIMRPLFWHFQDDSTATATGDQFLLGPGLLIAPILRQGATARSVYLPNGDWFDFDTGERLSGGRHVIALAELDRIPIYVRAGAIIPMIGVQQFVGEKTSREVELHLWPGGTGSLNWYEDDGQSMDYTRGIISERKITVTSEEEGNLLQFGETTGPFRSTTKTWRIVFRNAHRALRVVVDGREHTTNFDRSRQRAEMTLPNRRGPMNLKWTS